MSHGKGQAKGDISRSQMITALGLSRNWLDAACATGYENEANVRRRCRRERIMRSRLPCGVVLVAVAR